MILTFKQVEGKWRWFISGAWAFNFYQQYGFPPELIEEEINKKLDFMGSTGRSLFVLNEWIKFSKKH